jgi:hypothetical protein
MGHAIQRNDKRWSAIIMLIIKSTITKQQRQSRLQIRLLVHLLDWSFYIVIMNSVMDS